MNGGGGGGGGGGTVSAGGGGAAASSSSAIGGSNGMAMIDDAASDGGCAFDTSSSAVIRLNNATVLYMREVNKYLALVCILREDSFDFQGLIDYNFHCFRRAIQDVFELRAGAVVEKMAAETKTTSTTTTTAATGGGGGGGVATAPGKKMEVRVNGDVEPDEPSDELTQT